ncbi:MAG: epoxyqueuosine reductase [Deltaproteobacteria bacterium]|nr:epoxyqueuosine reductase [Deltaproteobacteria bacterium]MBW1924371.1 epoxyqueuosine reductase [Deltaproteobacteria bacterium]MBW1949383.1 epoxyqueuosine reductase [Deltaproteobacteria bacterium]MBW2007704.1 epoxyqueuosine reductase [Deltaproteobacteria bacterium]MBW2102155.1 epoxyqueuosine reductase [Deltaproteobacteria bacterium]
MDELTALVTDYVMRQGACAAGVATLETLVGGPPSADITYVLPEAKSAVSFAVPLEQEHIRPFLSKKDFQSHEQDNVLKNALSSGIGLHLSDFLEQRGYPSVPLAANLRYRTDTPRGMRDLMPPISLRYLAVRSGVGFFGLSGNVLTKKEGAGIILGGVVTAAELTPTDPIAEEENYCDGCKLCMASCPSGLMDPEEKAEITLGNRTFSYSRRKGYVRCEYVCGGFAGLHSSGKWSTWSPARFPIPEKDEDFREVFRPAAKAYWKRPEGGGGFYHPLMKTRIWQTCGNCQIVCHPDKEERKARYELLTRSGVVVENPDGSREAVSPEEAVARIEAMAPDRRALYEMP